MSIKEVNTPRYHLFGTHSVAIEDDYDKKYHFNDLQEAIERATNETEEDGRAQYVLEIVKVVRPIKKPYEVTVEDYKN